MNFVKHYEILKIKSRVQAPQSCCEEYSLCNTYSSPDNLVTGYLTPENMQKIREYNDTKEELGNGYGDFNMEEIDINSTDSNNQELKEGVWYKSRFLWDSSECNGCFTFNNKDDGPKFTKWPTADGKYSKLSGIGPAWK